jgi:hypothetical protein
MKNLIYPLLKEGYTSRNLQEETRKRMIPLLPPDGDGMPVYKRFVLRVKVFIKKLLKQYD